MASTLPNVIAVGIGGAIGAIVRFYVGIIINKNFPYDIPLATLSVNIIGSLYFANRTVGKRYPYCITDTLGKQPSYNLRHRNANI